MYVFGIDMPIMELLFVFMLLLVAALVVIWIEIRRLIKLVGTEQSDISRFEQATGKKKEAKSLDEFIKHAQENGMKKKDIVRILKEKGWDKKMVEEGFKNATKNK